MPPFYSLLPLKWQRDLRLRHATEMPPDVFPTTKTKAAIATDIDGFDSRYITPTTAAEVVSHVWSP